MILCAPLTDETHGMLGSAELAPLKDGALLMNVGRGELVDTDALTREASGIFPRRTRWPNIWHRQA